MWVMELKFLTPTEVWEGFDPSALPLESSIISSESADNLVCTKQYFTADETAQGRVRAYMEIYFDSRWADARAAIMLLPPCRSNDNGPIVRSLVAEGYAVCLLDYCGGVANETDRSTFPQGLEFASYPECQNHLDGIADTARNTPWFVWSKTARRALTLLAEQNIVDSTHIGIIGMGEGAHIAWQVAAMDARIRALVAVGDCGYRWAKNKSRFLDGNIPSTDEERAFSTGVGAETYAKFVQCPTLLIMPRSSHMSDVDRAGDILALVKSERKQLIIGCGNETQFTRSSFDVMLSWLRDSFSVKPDAATESPSFSFENIDGKLYMKLFTAHKAIKSEVYVCYGESISSARHWDTLYDLQKVDTHVYTVRVPVFDPNELIVAYATFTYTDSDCISTPLQAVIPSKIGVQKNDTLRESSRIIYDGSMGLGSFSCLDHEAILEENFLKQEIGPFDIKGITTASGGLSLCRSAAEVASSGNTSMLHFDAYSAQERELSISMYTYPELKKYTAFTELKGGEFWQKIILHCADFKSDEGKTLAKFADAKILFINNASGIIFNNFLWI